MNQQARYVFQPYQGPKTRHTCPQCGKPKTFTRYLDTKSNELLPEIFGRCDREDRCGYQLSPYDKGPGGRSYADDVWEESRQQFTSERRQRPPSDFRAPATYAFRRPAAEPDKIYAFPDEVVRPSLAHYNRNEFASLLRGQIGDETAAELLNRYGIGTSSFWTGATVFYLIDPEGRTRGGQVVLFSANWHTAKLPQANGEVKRCTNWIHKALMSRYRQRNEPVPDWLSDYDQNAPKFPIPFGCHLLATEPESKPVGIVEAPKTAVLCSAFFPELTWMAIGGLSYLTEERMALLRKRTILLFPDLSPNGSAYEDWCKRAERLRSQGFRVSVSDYLEKRASLEDRQEGRDLADYLIHAKKPAPKQPPHNSEPIPAKSEPERPATYEPPAVLKLLIDSLGLEIVQVRRLPDETAETPDKDEPLGYPPEWDLKPGEVSGYEKIRSPAAEYYASILPVSPDRVYTFKRKTPIIS